MGKIEIPVGFKEDGSLQKIIDTVQTAKDALTDSGKSTVFEQAGLGVDQINAINEMLTNSISTLTTLTTKMSEIPSYMQMASFGLKTELEGMFDLVNRINSSYKTIGRSELAQMDTARKMLSMSASIKANTMFMGGVNEENARGLTSQDYSKERYGFQDFSTFQRYANEIATQRLNPLINTLLNQNKHGFMNYESLVNQIMGNQSFYDFYQSFAKRTGAGYLTPKQVQNGIETIIAQNTLYGQQLTTGDILRKLESNGILKTPDKRDQFIQERLANDYQVRMFNTYSQDQQTENAARQYLISRSGKNGNGDLIRRYEKRFRKSNGLQELHEFLKQDDNMAQLFPLLREAGIATAPANSGYYHINSKIHESQLQYLAARAVQRYRDALGSEAPYEIDPTNYFNTAKTLNRQGKKPQLYSGLLRALPNDVIPSLTTYNPKDIEGKTGFAYNTGIAFGGTPSLNRYYIPSTKFDMVTGSVIERDPNWRKDLSKGIEQRDTDEYVAVTDSLVARMFGLHGNGTLGYGRDEKTGAIIRYVQDPKDASKKIAAPSPLLSIDFTQFLKEDENGKMVVNKNHPRIQEAMDYLAGRKLLPYGDQKYHYLYQDETGKAVFGLNDIYEQQVQRYESKGLRHPFHAGNEGDLLFGGSRTKFSKQAETTKKMASSAVPIEDLYDGLERLRTEAPLYVNFSMLYDMIDEINGTDEWGKESGKRMNGQVWADPNLIKKSMQMRFGMGTDKFMMSGVDWRPMLKQGWSAGNALNSRIFGRDEKGDIAVYVPGGHMSTEEDYAAVKSFVTGERYEVQNGKVVQARDEFGKVIPLNSDELLKIQNERMVNLLDKKAPVLMDREAMKSESGFRTLPIEKYRNPNRYGEAGLKKAIEEGRIEGNYVRLTAKEAAEDMLAYSREFDPSGLYSGYWALKNDEDMASSKEFLPESLLRAINAPVDVFERSERLYRERLAELNTMSGRIKQFQNDENAMAEIRRNPNWVFENQDAIRHITNTRNALLKNRAMNKILMPYNREGTVGQNTVGEIPEMFMALIPGLKPSAFGKFQALLPSVMDKANAVYAPGLSQEDISMMMRFPIATRQLALNVVNYAQNKEGKAYLKNIKTAQQLEQDIKDEQGYIKVQESNIEYFNEQLQLPNISDSNRKKITQQIANAQKKRDKYNESVQKKSLELDQIYDKIELQEQEADKHPDSAVAFIRARRLTGQDPLDVATTMSASMMYQFNTGDFDGDTIYAFYQMSKEAMERAQAEQDAFDAYKKGQKNMQKAVDTEQQIEKESAPITDEGLGKLEVMTQSINSKSAMAAASAALRKAQTADPNDPYRVAGLVESMEAYDKATSDVKKKGLEATMGEFAQMYLTAQGQHYERFTKALYENENEETPYGKKLFDVSFASKFDPEGIQALAFRRQNADGLGFIDTKSLELMEKWYADNYGGDISAEADAARFMLDRLEDSQIFGKIWTDLDSQRGWRKYSDWLSEIDAKSRKGINVDEDRDKLRKFRLRLEEQDSDRSVNEKSIREEISKYEQLYSKTNDEVYDKYVQQLYRMLPEDKTLPASKQDPANLIQDLTLKQRYKENKKRVEEIRGAMATASEDAALEARNQYRRTQAVEDAFDVDKMGESGRISPYNWSSVKHYIGARPGEVGAKVVMPNGKAIERLTLRGAVDENGKIKDSAYNTDVAPLVDYNRYQKLAESQKDLILALSGEDTKTSAYKNEATHVGSLMHSAFEMFFDPTNPLFSKDEDDSIKTPEERIKRAKSKFREMLLGQLDNETFDRMALTKLGFSVSEDESTGNLRVASSKLTTDQIQAWTSKLNNLVGFVDNSGKTIEGTFESFLKVMDVYANEGERTLSIEDRLYDKEGNLTEQRYGGSIWKQVVTDSDGKIIRTDYSLDKGGFNAVGDNEKSHIFLTHAKPDVARINNAGDITVYDFKSSESGAFESLLQSTFYADMFTALGRKAFEHPEDTRYEVFKPWVREVTKDDGTKEYVSAVKRVVGLSPQGQGENVGIDFTKEEGRNWAIEQLGRINEAFLNLEEAGLNNLPQGMALLIDEATKYKTVHSQTEAAAKKAEDFKKAENSGIAEYFLSTFASQREQLSDLQKNVRQDYGKYHQNLDRTGINKFSERERQLNDLFDEDVKAAYIAHHGNTEAIRKELDKISLERMEALELNSENAKVAAVQDIKDAKATARQAFLGVKPTTEADVVIGAFQTLAKAQKTKDYLKENKEYYNPDIENDDGTRGKFLTEGDDARAQEAKDREKRYKKAVEEGEEAEAFILSEGQKYVNRYTSKDAKRIQNLIRTTPLSASEKFGEFIESQAQSLQQEIDTYNETITKLTEQKSQTNDPKKQLLLEDLIKHAETQRDELNKYMLSGGLLDKTLKQERERLGIITKTPQQRAEEWFNQRKMLVDGSVERDALVVANSNLIAAANSGDSEKLKEAARAKEAAQARFDKWAQESSGTSQERVEELKRQSVALEDMWTNQEKQPLVDFLNRANRTAPTKSDYVNSTLASMQAQATQMATNEHLSAEQRNLWNNILTNNDFWEYQRKLAGEDYDKNKDLMQFQHDQRISDLQFQREQSHLAREQQYRQHNRNMMGQSTSRFVNAYRASRDYRFSLGQTYEQNVHAAEKEQKNIERLEKEIASMGKTPEQQKLHANYAKTNNDLEEARERLQNYKEAAGDAQQQMAKFSKPASIMNAAFQSVSGTMNMLISRFGRQLFSNALRETTNFVKQFDASMNQIQMITLKSNEEIDKLGDSLIEKAKDMKISVSEVSQSATTLYRQGLSDQEVDERLEVISKFSKVSGTKVDAATKLVTVAMNTGLVQQAEEAADIVTALGDNAATNAAEIEKGIEKAGAAAAADGTTFAELSAMLTAITSTTQIGGNVAGRTLNTIFGRMNKIGTTELIYDENGNAISGSQVAKLLETQGIRMYDEQGNKRSTYETLYALSQKWEGMSDAEQQQMASAIAGTRQYSNFAAIMQGMSEGKVDEYLQLAGESSGITDKKFQIYEKSLAASITDLKNTWDGLVNDMTNSGALGGALDFFSNFISGVDQANNSLGGLGVTLTGILPTLMMVGGLKAGGWGLAVAAAGGIWLGLTSLLGNQKSDSEKYKDTLDAVNNYEKNRSEQIARAEELQNKGNDRTEAENREYDKILKNLSVSIDSIKIEGQTEEAQNLSRREQAQQIIEQAAQNNKVSRIKGLAATTGSMGKAAISQYNETMKAYDNAAESTDSTIVQSLLESYEGYSNLKPEDRVFNFRRWATSSMGETGKNQLKPLMAAAFANNTAFKDIVMAEVSRTGQDPQAYLENLINDSVRSFNNYGERDADLWDAFFNWYKDEGYAGSREEKSKEEIKRLYLDFFADWSPDWEPEKLNAVAEQATKDYFEDKQTNRELAFTDRFNDIYDLANTQRTNESIEAKQNAYFIKAGYISKTQQKFNNAGLEYVSNGYYKNNKNGLYYTTDETEKALDEYSDSLLTPFKKIYEDIVQEYPNYGSLSEAEEKDVLAKIKGKFAAYGLEFNGLLTEFFDFDLDSLSDIIKNIKPDIYSASDFTAIRNHFQAQAETTYKTWADKNQLALNAGSMYRLIKNTSEITDLQSLFDYINGKNVGQWDVLNTNEDFAKLTRSVQRDTKTGKVTGPESLYEDIISVIRQMSSEYGEENLSSSQKATRIYDALANLTEAGYYSSYQELQDAIDAEYGTFVAQHGNVERSEFIRTHGWQDQLSKYLLETDRNLVLNTFGSRIGGKLLLGNEDLSDFEDWYTYSLLQSMKSGYDGLTKGQQLHGLKMIQGMSIDQLKEIQNADFLDKLGYNEIGNYIAAVISGGNSQEEKNAITAFMNIVRTQEREIYNTGYLTDKIQPYVTAVSEARDYSNIQDVLSGDISTEEERRAISTVLGLSDQDIKTAVKSGDKSKLQRLLDDKVGKMFEELADKLGVSTKDANFLTNLQNAASAAGDDVLDEFNILMDLVEGVITDAQGFVHARARANKTETVSDIYESAAESYSKQNQLARAADFVNNHIEEISAIQGNRYFDVQAYNNAINSLIQKEGISKDDAVKRLTGDQSFYGNYSRGQAIEIVAQRYGVKPEELRDYLNSTIGLEMAVGNGIIDESVLQLYNDAQISGGKYKNELDNALLQGLFGTAVGQYGKFDEKHWESIYETMSMAKRDSEEGTGAIWGILVNDIPELADAFQMFANGETQAGIDVLEEVFKTVGHARVDEMIKYGDATKDVKEALYGIAEGGAAASIGFTELSDAIQDSSDKLLALKKAAGKEGKQLNSSELYYLSQATGIDKNDLKKKSKEEIDALITGQEEKQMKNAENVVIWAGSLLNKEGFNANAIKLDEEGYFDFTEATKKMSTEDQKAWKDYGIFLKSLNNSYFGINNSDALFKQIGVTGYDSKQLKLSDKVKKQVEKTYNKVGKELNSLMQKTDTEAEDYSFDISGHVVFTGDETDAVKKGVASINKEIDKSGIGIHLKTYVNDNAVGGSGGGSSNGSNLFNGILGPLLQGLGTVTNNPMLQAAGTILNFVGNTKDKFGGKKNTGGRGGGGGNAVSNLINKQKYEIGLLTHKRTMAQIEQTHYDKVNDYGAYDQSLNDEVNVLGELQSKQKEHIAALEEQRKKTKEDSQEYRTLTEAINSAQEALDNYVNEIDEVNAKRITNLQSKQDDEDRLGTFYQSMLEQYAERYQLLGNYRDYEDTLQNQIDQNDKDLELNKQQLSEWENLLKTYEEGTDNWNETYQKILDMKVANAELENDTLSKEQQLNEARLSRIANILSYNTMDATHDQSIASTYGQYYQNVGARAEYNTTLERQIDLSKELEAHYRRAYDESIKERDSREKGSQEWFEANAKALEYLENAEQQFLSTIENARALQESFLAGVTEGFSDATNKSDATITMLDKLKQEYYETNNFDAYNQVLSAEKDPILQRMQERSDAIDALKDKIENEPMDLAMRRQYVNQYNQYLQDQQADQFEINNIERELSKSKIDQMLDKFDKTTSLHDHNMQLVQYEETKYQNAGELANYGKMLEAENKLREDNIETTNAEIEALEKQREEVVDNVEQYNRLTQQIMKKEESVKSDTNAIEKNTKAIKENNQKIRDARKSLEESVEQQLKAEEQRNRDMLAATVSLQDSILEVIKSRYRDEFSLIQKSVEEEKKALQEKKDIMNEELNYRKKAQQAANRDAEIVELQRQLALIQADPTRLKEAKEIQQRLEELEQERGWEIAEDELNNENKEIDNIIEAKDDFLNVEQENLDELLKDAHNFADEINEVLSGNAETINRFMAQYNEEFKNSLDEKQQQMVQSWEDTYKKMKNIYDDYYSDILEKTGNFENKEAYLEYKMSSDEYLQAKEAGNTNEMERLRYQYEELWENYANTLKTGAEFTPHDETFAEGTTEVEVVSEQIEELKKNIFSVKITGEGQGTITEAEKLPDKVNNGERVMYEDKSEGAENPNKDEGKEGWVEESTGWKYYENGKVKTGWIEDDTGWYYANDKGTMQTGWQKINGKWYYLQRTSEELGEGTYKGQMAADAWIHNDSGTWSYVDSSGAAKIGWFQDGSDWYYADDEGNIVTGDYTIGSEKHQFDSNGKWIKKYALGGLADYTGFAWVDGTKSRPEAFLDAYDTQSIRMMMDALNYVRAAPTMTHLDSSLFGGSNTSIGDININLYEAKLESDADYDEVARRVGQAFSKELSKQGMNLAGYAF